MNDPKAVIRSRMRERAREMDPQRRLRDSARACEWVTGMVEFERAHVVGTYLATAREVDTADMIKVAHTRGKRVCVPAWRPDLEGYGLCWLGRDTALHEGRLKILEPALPRWIDEAVEFMVVPGLAFDATGARLGHGGGFYDRLALTEEARSAVRAGLAFDWQVTANVPMHEHDVYVDAVVTEKGVLQIGG